MSNYTRTYEPTFCLPHLQGVLKKLRPLNILKYSLCFQAQQICCSVVSCTIISLADMTINSSIARLEAILNSEGPKFKIFCAEKQYEYLRILSGCIFFLYTL